VIVEVGRRITATKRREVESGKRCSLCLEKPRDHS
jgi:hypothetical protein